ncbi:unnamed protein product [Litomosoides sigmodontis]|uniref:BZIP domain-containing protein n=1 Tax=Litomosoides sigmodontis TaxID=42156 RepID=A0A3P6U4M7_LITSI|nr:unnamed protein product [Litomosoides sigmodontis]
MSAISSAAATTADLSTSSAASLKQLKSSMHLDFSSPTSSKKQIISADLLDIIKASPTIGKMFSQGTTTPTPTKLLYPSEVTLAQRQYAQGFIDALTQVQQLNGFVPSPALLNSPSFLAPLFQSVTASTSNNDQTKTVTSPVLTSPNRESLSVIMQAAMSGMSSLAGYNFTQLAPTQLTPYAVATSSTATTAACVLQQQPVGSSSTATAVVHPDDIVMKNELPGCSSVTSLRSDSINDASTYDAYATSESNEIEACTLSIRSSASPRSQEEHIFMDPFSGDSYDALEQEKKKLERKRARNRLAASKCRQKKLQKINDLEKQVEEEKLRSNRLNEDLKILETSIAQLRQLLQEHHNNGCSISAKVIST